MPSTDAYRQAVVRGWTGETSGGAIECAPDDLIVWAERQRVLPQVLPFLPPETQASVSGRIDRERNAKRSLLSLLTPVVAADASVVFAKGFAVERHYPSQVRRQFVDLDLQVRNLDRFWLLHERLQPLGLCLTALALRRPPAGGEWSAAAHYDLGTCPGEDGAVSLDVDIGPLWLGGRAHLSLEDAFWTDTAPDALIPEARLLGAAASLVRLAAEVAERKSIMLRDILDVVALSGAARTSLAAEATTTPRLAAALKVLASNALMIDREMPFVPHERHETLLELARLKAVESLEHFERRDLWSELRQGFSLRGQDLAGGPRHPWERLERRLDPRARMLRGDWIQFLPISPVLRGNISWLSRAKQAVLATPIGCFAPALFGGLSAERLQALGTLCEDALVACDVAATSNSPAAG